MRVGLEHAGVQIKCDPTRWRFTAVVLVAVVSQTSLVYSIEPDRAEFAENLSAVKPGDKKRSVLQLLGRPDEVRRIPESSSLNAHEIWCYGTDGKLLATLGEVYFLRTRVAWVAGGWGEPPSKEVISEEELRAGMHFLHPGPEHVRYNDPLHLIRATNYLQPLGKEKALAIIGEYSRILDGVTVDQLWLYLLLRTLFDVPEPPGYMPDLPITLGPSPPQDRSSIPRFPIIIIDDIPFSVLLGLGGMTGPPRTVWPHIQYFHEHGTLRKAKLRPPDDPYPSIQKLRASDQWWKLVLRSVGLKEGKSNFASPRPDAGNALLQVLALGRTAYEPPEARQPDAVLEITQYERHYARFLEAECRWDEELQIYVRRDGTHGEIGRLADDYP